MRHVATVVGVASLGFQQPADAIRVFRETTSRKGKLSGSNVNYGGVAGRASAASETAVCDGSEIMTRSPSSSTSSRLENGGRDEEISKRASRKKSGTRDVEDLIPASSFLEVSAFSSAGLPLLGSGLAHRGSGPDTASSASILTRFFRSTVAATRNTKRALADGTKPVSFSRQEAEQDPSVNKKGCFKLTNETDVVFESKVATSDNRMNPEQCAQECELAQNLPSYAILYDGGSRCECAHDLEWTEIGWDENCESKCPNGDSCGGDDGYATVYWWHRCPDEDPLNNRCKCPHGNAPTGPECPEDGADMCLDCDRGYELNGETCEPVECVCSHGEASEAVDCPKHGANHCAKCFEYEGFHLNETTNACELNVCLCPGGEPATGVDCAKHGEETKCASCFDEQGFVLADKEKDIVNEVNGTRCMQRQCECKNGKGASGAECPMHGSAVCVSCDEDEGFKLDGDECIPRECRCAHGEAPIGKKCPKGRDEEGEYCSSCYEDEGYHMTKKIDICEVNECTCKNGEPSMGATCAKHDTEHCASCNVEGGFELNPKTNSTCRERVCTCGNGTAAVGVDCPETGSLMCTKCEPGYDLNEAGECLLRKCICELGEAATGTDCPTAGDEKCMKCKVEGFHLDDFKCLINECKCKGGGEAAMGADCPEHGMKKCSKCAPGFTKATIDDGDDRTSKCVENTCTCENGTGAVNTACPEHESPLCAQCDPGFDLGAGKCAFRVCECQNGKPAEGTKCPKEAFEKREEVCVSCNDTAGYFLDEAKKQCLLKECVCANGVGTVGPDCTKDGEEVCESCDVEAGFILNSRTRKCEQKVCTCEFGVGARGTNCYENATEMCASCDEGTDFMFGMGPPGFCVENECWCMSGVGAKGKDCPGFGVQVCTTCDEGMYLNDEKVCETKECTCENGIGTLGEECAENGAEECSKCAPGFELKGEGNAKKCVAKGCACENGVAATGPDCPRHDEEICESCNTGFHLDRDACVPNECNCPHGTPFRGEACPEDGKLKCQPDGCSDGYHFEESSGKCEANECTCPAHGEAANGAMCTEHGARMCTACDYGWKLNAETKLCSDFEPEYQGCYEDNGDRDLPARLGPWTGSVERKNWLKATPESCHIACHNYEYFSIQAGGECWCGNAVDFAKKNEHDCVPCKHDDTLTCGAGWRNSVYKHSPDVAFAGCFGTPDVDELRGLDGVTIYADDKFTFEKCYNRCGGKDAIFFAFLEGNKCVCSANAALVSKFEQLGDEQCLESPCESADAAATGTSDEWMCGGGSALSVYKYAGASECGRNGWKCVNGVAYHYGTPDSGDSEKRGPNKQCPTGATLAIVESDAQARFLRMMMGAKADFFVGPHDRSNEGAWMTADQNVLLKQKKYTPPWNAGEPNDWGKREDCAVILKNGKWNDDKCSNVEKGDRFFACSEREP
ncbi:unnamed protein product [Amoebophrya sp. A25]|nr:unnamed protein product [Amoebophrya sp. A25]|eukprot:GSA25T00000245001.1